MVKFVSMRFYIKTFGCQANVADSERISAAYLARGFSLTEIEEDADHLIINTCMVRESAENRVYGMVNNLGEWKERKDGRKIIVTGCLVGLAVRDSSGKILKKMKERMPNADEFLSIEEVGFDIAPLRSDKEKAWVPISVGCNNYCSYCIVPFTRGKEVSRDFEKIIAECFDLKERGYSEVTLIGQNVNSYGADIVQKNGGFNRAGKRIEPVVVSHLGKNRIPTLFPYLLSEVAKLGFSRVNFISSNPWDFSDELIAVIKENKNISREIHLPLQSGDDEVLKKMNRWYTRKEYLELVEKIKNAIPEIKISTDIIVGFSGETEEQFRNTVEVCERVNFSKAYISMYSPRARTLSEKEMTDNVPHSEKRRRWLVLDEFINKSARNYSNDQEF